MSKSLFLNKICNLKIKTVEGNLLFYTNSKILILDNNFITFLDSRTNQKMCFSLDQLAEIKEVKNGES